MKHEGRAASVNQSEERVEGDPEETMVAPRFDEKSIRKARPAVPFSPARGGYQRLRKPLMLALGAVLLGVIAGVVGLSLYQNRREDSRATAVRGRTPDAAVVETPEEKRAELPTEDSSPPDAAEPGVGVESPSGEQAALRESLREWIDATNARDIQRQMSFYNPRLDAYYLTRNASARDVRAEKVRVFNRASLIDVQAGDPEISLAPDGQTATMRFRKRYQVEGRRGEVVQELRWRKTDSGWKIVSERDLRVLN